jgi:hypothetical protein
MFAWRPAAALALHAGYRAKSIDQLVQPILGQLDLGCRFLDVDEARAHRGRQCVQVPDVLEDLDRESPERVEASLLRKRASVSLHELAFAKRVRMAYDELGAASRKYALIDNAIVLSPRFVREPESADEFDAIVFDTECHVVASPFEIDGGDVRHFELLERRHGASP